ncbi:MAG: ribosome assembly factor SBDS [Euryarchaeota archaeon]|nr:ribosome assembly factor SBDS [Euryarchaeota archaeon]MDE1836161.1 ribosome assembly factor SBDS [Euryarchaeota archaeon]MDE1881016.1 ribosome assembly factor SBDS [Euryarchaeota archaeon]MDE2045476.1 ribosome assembly factor SBDS [Thermoplasmata archaeon]
MQPGREKRRREAADAVVARLVIGGNHFEVLVDPAAVQALKDGKDLDLREHLPQDQIYKDAKKGDKISSEFLEKQFHTSDVYAIAKEIIRKGEVQVTTDQRRAMVEAKRKQIVDYISRNAINPQTNAPHPPARIAAAMDEAKYHVDPFRSVEAQVEEVLARLRPLLPIRLEHVKLKLRVPGQYYPKVIGEIKASARLVTEEWLSDGGWSAVVEIPGGIQTEFLERLNARAKGQIESAMVK